VRGYLLAYLYSREEERAAMSSSKAGGLRAAFGCTPEALALFRIAVGVLLVSELVLRFRFLHVFYTDEGYGRLRE
jgi:hypothetical protein